MFLSMGWVGVSVHVCCVTVGMGGKEESVYMCVYGGENMCACICLGERELCVLSGVTKVFMEARRVQCAFPRLLTHSSSGEMESKQLDIL